MKPCFYTTFCQIIATCLSLRCTKDSFSDSTSKCYQRRETEQEYGKTTGAISDFLDQVTEVIFE